MKFKAKTLEGKEVIGWYWEYLELKKSYIKPVDRIGGLIDPEIDPTTLRVLINGKEYKIEEVEEAMAFYPNMRIMRI